MSRNILHCDMNNFYASVECLLDPEIRKYPVAVCGEEKQRHGIVLAKNQTAASMGIKTGDTVTQAKRKAPKLVTVAPHFGQYYKFSLMAQKIYCRYSDLVEPFGPDECWIDITGTESLFGSPLSVANKIKEEIKSETGLTVSVGVSFNKVFSKLGSDMKKPDAVTEITSENFKKKVWNLPAEMLLGVGSSTFATLCRHGIFTIGDLANSDERWLGYALGKNGIKLKNYANGIDLSAVCSYGYARPVQSVGRGITTSCDLTDSHEVWCVILELAQTVSHQLRQVKKRAGGVSVQIKNSNLSLRQSQTRLNYPTQSPMKIAKTAFSLFESFYTWDNGVRAVTIQAISLENENSPFQTDIFYDFKKAEKTEKLENCIETIRAKFGRNSIKNAVLLNNTEIPESKGDFWQ